MHPKSKEFLKLQAEWDEKLKESGFKDLEIRGDDNLKSWASSRFVELYRPQFYEAKQEYYRLAGHFLHDYKFADATEKDIWRLHADGLSVRKIAKYLKTTYKGVNTHFNTVQIIIKRLKEEMIKRCKTQNQI